MHLPRGSLFLDHCEQLSLSNGGLSLRGRGLSPHSLGELLFELKHTSPFTAPSTCTTEKAVQ
jgi:hypothetical protein